MTRDYGNQTGTYICTLDNYHSDVDAIDYSTSEQPAEHKSHNLLELDNGQFALYPNNRMRIYDNSITPRHLKHPILRFQLCIIKLKTVMIVMDWVQKRIISGKQQKKEAKK